MFGKLMNYELRYLSRIFVPMWVVVLLLCVLTRILVPFSGDAVTFIEGNRAAVTAIVVFLTVLAVLTSVLVTFIVVLQRYTKGLFGDEGYLLFTLPVTTWQLVHAKGLSAVLMLVITETVTVLGVVIAASHNAVLGQISNLYGMVMYMNDLSAAGVAMQIFWIILASIATMAQGVYQIYLAITMGQMWKKHPVIGAIAAFYGVQLVISAIEYGVTMLLGLTPQMLWNSALWIVNGADWMQMLMVMGYVIGKSVILVLLFSFLSKLFLEKRLELQ